MNAIELNHITKHYPGFDLSDICLQVPEGMIMGLVGENGAGKTTLIRTLLGIIPSDEGTFSVLGCSDPHHDKQIMNEIGAVLDSSGLPAHLTAAETASLLSEIYTDWDNAYFSALIKQLRVPADKRFHEQSKGNQQKIAIICALSHHPKLLVLDEATSGLDPVVRDEILDLFLEFTRDEQHSILMSSHIVSDLEKACDLITFLHEGKILLSGGKDELKESYRMIHCTKEVIRSIDPAALIGMRENPYGAEAVIRADAVPAGIDCLPADLEELFVMMVKGDSK